MSDIKQAHAMLSMAQRDLMALGGMRDTEIFADEIFGFHVQQAVEKSLKAWMCAIGITYPFSHQINRLLVLLRDAGADVQTYWWLDEFTLFAQQARYEEGYLAADAPLEREKLLHSVTALASRVSHEIKLRASPIAPPDHP